MTVRQRPDERISNMDPNVSSQTEPPEELKSRALQSASPTHHEWQPQKQSKPALDGTIENDSSHE